MDEKKFLANFAKILGAESTFEELEQKRLKEERMLASLSKSLGAEDILEDIKKKEDQLIENMNVTLSKYQVAEQQAIIEQVSKELEEAKEQLAEDAKQEEPEIPASVFATPAVEKIAKEKPKKEDIVPPSLRKELDYIKKSITDFHRFAQRHSQMSGGGAVWLRDLNDIARSSVLNAANGQVLTYNTTTSKWEAQDVTVTANGVVGTLHQVTTEGNTTNNNIFVNAATAAYFAVNTAASYSVSTGEIAWNASDLTFDMGMTNGVTLQVGQEQYMKVKAYEAISDGQAVMFAGVDGDHILVRKYSPVVAGFIPEWYVGVATQDLAHNGFGYVTTYGKIHNLNTLAWSAGDILYADNSTPGALTNIEPTAPNPHIIVAAVTKRAGGDGHIMVRPTPRPFLRNLSDITIATPANGQVLMYISSSNTWVNQSIQGYQTTAGLSANVATLSSNNSLYLGGIAANQYAFSNQITTYSLPAANTTTLGGIKVDGTTITITSNTISANLTNYAVLNANVTFNNITANSVASNNATAFIVGNAAISAVAISLPQDAAFRDRTNGISSMYFDVSNGGSTHGVFQFRSSNTFNNVLTMSPTAFNVNTNAVVTAKTASFGRLPWNSAIDTELTIDDYRFRINNTGGNVYAQIISNVSGQTKNSAWTAVAAISGSAVTQGGSTGVLVPNNSWTSLYTFGSMNSAGDTITVTLQDKVQGRIYRVTFMRSDDGSTTGYNIIAERLI